MRLLVIGSRAIPGELAYEMVEGAIIKSGLNVTEIISGGAKGAEGAGELFGVRHEVPVRLFVADHERGGRNALAVRNRIMVMCCDVILALWDGKTPTVDVMLGIARENGKQVIEINYES